MRRPISLFLLISVACLIFAILLLRRRQVPASVAPTVAPPIAQVTRMQGELAKTLAENDALEREIESLRKKNQTIKPVTNPPQKTPAVIQEPVEWPALPMKLWGELAANPQTIDMWLGYNRAQENKKYSALFGMLEIAGPKLAALMDLLVERRMSYADIGEFAMDGGNLPSLTKEIDDKFETQLRALLTPEEAELFFQVDRNPKTWGAIQRFAVQLPYAASLDRLQVAGLMRDWDYAVSVGSNAGMSDTQVIEAMNARNESLLNKSSSYLTPVQLASLRGSLAAGVIDQRAFLEWKAAASVHK
jgi:hypothetical protein